MKSITDAKAQWQSGGLAVVCEKCLNERFIEDFPEHTGDPRLDDMKGYLKRRLKSDGHAGPIRIVMSSCLDICARGGLTALLDPLGDPAKKARCIVVDALEGRDALYDAIVSELSPPGKIEKAPV